MNYREPWYKSDHVPYFLSLLVLVLLNVPGMYQGYWYSTAIASLIGGIAIGSYAAIKRNGDL